MHPRRQALEDGVITQVISDHSPCTTDLKLLEDGDFLKVLATCFGVHG